MELYPTKTGNGNVVQRGGSFKQRRIERVGLFGGRFVERVFFCRILVERIFLGGVFVVVLFVLVVKLIFGIKFVEPLVFLFEQRCRFKQCNKQLFA